MSANSTLSTTAQYTRVFCRRSISCFNLALLLVTFGCSALPETGGLAPFQASPTLPAPAMSTSEPPNVGIVSVAFLDAWESEDYVGMYSLLSPLSKAAISMDAFVERYEEIVDAAAITSVETTILSTVQEGLDAQVLYQVLMRTALVGTIRRDILMELHYESGRWSVSWHDGLVLPELAGGNSLFMEYTIPARGNIYDRNGHAFATHANAVALGVIRGKIDPVEESALLSELGWLMDRHPEALRSIYADADPDWYIPIGEVSAQAIEERYDVLSTFSGLVMNPYQTRFYVGGSQGAPHAVGYIALIPEDQEDHYRSLGYRGDEFVGSLGLEAWGEDYLSGERGGTLYVAAPGGNITARLAEKKSYPSQAITTTLDREFQREAQAALQGMPGSIVVLNIHTGEVLAMASAPTFDPNLFDPTNYNMVLLNEVMIDPYRPLLNRSSQGLYAPGSIFKVITVAGALESKLFTPRQTYYCGRTWNELGPSYIKYDWTYEKELPASGDLDIIGAIRRSCNPWFYHIGLRLHNWADYYLPDVAMRFGLGSPTGIVGLKQENNEEVGGFIPGPDWSNEQGSAWTSGNTVNMAIGQGEVSVTPLQMAMIYAALGNGGTLYRPQLVLSIAAPGEAPSYVFEPDVVGELPMSKETLDVIREGLWQVVNHKSGTANWRFRDLDIPVFGKTGTAEDRPRLPHAWFIGFTNAQREDIPDIAIAVVLENRGEGSEWAAPIFRRVTEVYFRGRIDTLYPWESEIGLTATPEPTLTPTPAAHVVQPGESLASIALAYDVPLHDILVFNEIDNPDVLAVGQDLIIPLGGLPELTATPENDTDFPIKEETAQP